MLEDLGEDNLRRMHKAHQSEVESRMKAIQVELEELRNGSKLAQENLKQSEESRKRSEVEQFNSTLFNAVPSMAKLNNDPGFEDWLNKPATSYSNYTRMDAFTEAYNSRNIVAIKALADEYQAFLNKAFMDKGGVQVNTNVADQVLPEGNTSQPPSTQGKRIYTAAEYKAEYTKLYNGQIKGADAKVLEAELDLAVAEGRVKA